jgi:hypothetical protein
METASFLTYDDELVRIAFIKVPALDPKLLTRDSPGLHHIAFTFNTMWDMTAAYSQRKALGIVPIWCTNHAYHEHVLRK